MAETPILLALAGPARPGEPHPLASHVMMGLIFAIFYFVLILPMRRKQRKLEQLVKEMKTGDRVVLSSGIFGTIVGAEDDAFLVRIDDKTRIKVLKSAVAGLQAPGTDKTEK
jgi:preprotein translocase subunit YajC